MRRLFVVMMLVLTVGCSNEPPDFIKQNNQPPQHKTAKKSTGEAQPGEVVRSGLNEMSVTIEPEEATRNTVLKVKTSGIPLKDAQIIWLLNGVPTSTPRVEVFDSPEMGLMKGDTVQAKATIDGEEVLSNIVTIANAKPVIERVNYVIPDALEANSHLSVDVVVKDEDDDPVTLEYKWEKNGIDAGSGPAIDLALQRGDEFSITVTPFDGEEYGQPDSFTRTVGNFPPKVAQQYAFTYENGVYTYQIEAEDPDGDTLTYVLKSGPPGMVVNSTTGLMTWNAPVDYKGTAPFVMAVQDGQGGETQMEMSLIVEGGAPPAPAQ